MAVGSSVCKTVPMKVHVVVGQCEPRGSSGLGENIEGKAVVVELEVIVGPYVTVAAGGVLHWVSVALVLIWFAVASVHLTSCWNVETGRTHITYLEY